MINSTIGADWTAIIHKLRWLLANIGLLFKISKKCGVVIHRLINSIYWRHIVVWLACFIWFILFKKLCWMCKMCWLSMTHWRNLGGLFDRNWSQRWRTIKHIFCFIFHEHQYFFSVFFIDLRQVVSLDTHLNS